jgi:hypothetical protein
MKKYLGPRDIHPNDVNMSTRSNTNDACIHAHALTYVRLSAFADDLPDWLMTQFNK